MVDAEQLAILKQGVEVWNAWRERHREIEPDLSWADLSNAQLECRPTPTELTVIFELWLNAGKRDDYLGLAGELRPELLRMDGFLGNERFESRREPGKMLALSFWRDEQALAGWRAHAGHRVAQARGRREILRDYRMRLGEIADSAADGAARAVSLVEVEPGASPVTSDLPPDAVEDRETFESIYNPGKLAVVLSWRDMAAARPWLAHPALAGPDRLHRLMRVVRDYGRTRREEAPRPPVA